MIILLIISIITILSYLGVIYRLIDLKRYNLDCNLVDVAVLHAASRREQLFSSLAQFFPMFSPFTEVSERLIFCMVLSVSYDDIGVQG